MTAPVSVALLVTEHHCPVAGPTIAAMYQVQASMESSELDNDEILEVMLAMLPVVAFADEAS